MFFIQMIEYIVALILFIILIRIFRNRKTKLDFDDDVDDTWFVQICLGNQTILGVAGDKNRFHALQKWVGYHCCLYNKNCRIQKILVNAHYYETLEDFIKDSGYKQCAPQTTSDKEAYQLYKSTYEIQHLNDHEEDVGIIGLTFR